MPEITKGEAYAVLEEAASNMWHQGGEHEQRFAEALDRRGFKREHFAAACALYGIESELLNPVVDAPDQYVIDSAVGGVVCSVCETPTESEPCREHQPRAWRAIN